MISLDNEMHMSIVDEIQIIKLKKKTTKCFVSIPILTSFLYQKKNKIKTSKGVQGPGALGGEPALT